MTTSSSVVQKCDNLLTPDLMRGRRRVVGISARSMSSCVYKRFVDIPPEVAKIAEGCGVNETVSLRAVEDSSEGCVGVPYLRSHLWVRVKINATPHGR